MRIHTIGHSMRSAGEFLDLVGEFGIGLLIDVRRFPASRRFPQFSREALRSSLATAGIAYSHEPDLGGRREPRPDSPNVAWRGAAFRGYADHMASVAFESALGRLLEGPPAGALLLCAEAVPWRCHRQLIADALVAHGVEVQHILGTARSQRHGLSPAARIGEGGRLIYDRAVPAGSASAQRELFRDE